MVCQKGSFDSHPSPRRRLKQMTNAEAHKKIGDVTWNIAKHLRVIIQN